MDATTSAANGYPMSRVEDGSPRQEICGYSAYSGDGEFQVCTRPPHEDGWHIDG